MSGASDARIAYVLKGFPRLSESFIANEVRILSKMQLSLGLFSIKRGDELAQDNNLPPVHYLPAVTSLSQTTLWRWLQTNYPAYSINQRYWFTKHPVRYVRTLLFSIRCAIRYRRSAQSGLKKSFIKEFLLATHIAREIECDGRYLHVHAHFCHDATTVAWMVSALTELPFSFTAHAKDIYKKNLNPGDLLQRKLAAAEFAVTCTEANVAHLREQTTASSKIVGIYHGLNTRTFRPLERKGSHRHTTAAETPRLLSVGRLVEKKGFAYLIEACQVLRNRNVRFHLDIVGEDGDQGASLRALIEHHALQDCVTLRQPVQQQALLSYYRTATVFVLPCVILDDGDRDGIPNVMAEAMACGLPVVVSRVSGIPELVEHEVSGILVPPRDTERLADAIEQLLTRPHLRSEIGTAARHRIESVFNADSTHIQLKELFDDALASNATRNRHAA